MDRYAKKQIKTFAEATNCGDHGLVEDLQKVGYPDIDVVQYLVAQKSGDS